VFDTARCLAQPGDGRLNGHRAKVRIVDGDEGASRAQVFVGEQLLRVVDRCGRNVFGEEHLHGLVERVRANPLGDQCVDLIRPRLTWDRVDVFGAGRKVGSVDGSVEARRDA